MNKIEDDSETTLYYLECEGGGTEEWHWTAKSTKLMVELYYERRQKFRDPKTRKRALWTEIVDEMERAGYKGINEDICDRKWRNMKKTYRTCRESLRKNGRKRVAWDYYDTFDDMFQSENTNITVKTESDRVSEEHIPLEDICATIEDHRPGANASNSADMSVTQEHHRQLLILERNRIAAIRELSKRVEESNAIQRERNDLLREYLSQLE